MLRFGTEGHWHVDESSLLSIPHNFIIITVNEILVPVGDNLNFTALCSRRGN